MGDFNSEHNRAVWFDIPVADLDRAIVFYGDVLAIGVHRESFEGFEFAVLDHDQGNGGCLVPNTGEVADTGVLIYLNVDGRIRDAVEKVRAGGGAVKQDIHQIGPHGYRAIISDCEGNCVALHSRSDA
ncbi:MAG: VOC family protein [Planctomycetota bacterium]